MKLWIFCFPFFCLSTNPKPLDHYSTTKNWNRQRQHQQRGWALLFVVVCRKRDPEVLDVLSLCQRASSRRKASDWFCDNSSRTKNRAKCSWNSTVIKHLDGGPNFRRSRKTSRVLYVFFTTCSLLPVQYDVSTCTLTWAHQPWLPVDLSRPADLSVQSLL